MSTPAFARTTPVTPPTVNKKMKPKAHNIGILKVIEPPPHGGNPRKYFYPRWNSNDHSGSCKIGTCVNV